MSLYWIHVNAGTEAVMYGPFENPEVHDRFRAMYGDDENDEGYRRSVDELPELPGIGEQDNHEEDTWIAVQGDNVFLFGARDTYAVRETGGFEVSGQEFRAGPMLSE